MNAANPEPGPTVSRSLERLASRVDSVEPSQLLSLLSVSDIEKQPQAPEELASVLEDLLTAPVDVTLHAPEELSVHEGWATPSCAPATFKSLHNLLHHVSPDLQLLELVKRAAKLHIDHRVSEVPQGVATVIYYAAIASALTRCAQRITTLTDDELRQGLHWVLERNWAGDTTKELVRQALRAIEQNSSGKVNQ